ncbi:MAG TPA: MFS transporter [Bryobacteraceae bacterium]|jgi:FHS family glucose/mannose:H+ symporter-like MFS transporter|nr:MFS transporter [Bryobacteraceae bacterium]
MQVRFPEPATAPPATGDPLGSSSARRALAGFFVSGVLLSFLGAILFSWQHHLTSQYGIVGLYYAGLIAGLVGSARLSPALLRRKGIGWTLALACLLAGSAFLYLAFVSPPFSPWWRVAGMAIVGFAAGLLHTAIFHAISPMYRHDPAATVNLAGILFGAGCFTLAILISGTFYLYTAAAVQVWIAVIPALFGWMYRRTQFPADPVPNVPAARESLSELRSTGAVLLSLLLFFQLGNEWGLAGWLALFLSQRLGISPPSALGMLALYWLALTIGRAASQWILPRARHGRLLLATVTAAMFGCIILGATDNRFGAIAGVLLVGGAFAPIYPLLVEMIGHRFPSYHPGFYNGIFSLAMAGGLLTPGLMGYIASVYGVRMIMLVPLIGSVVVFVLLLLIWLESRLRAYNAPPTSSVHSA